MWALQRRVQDAGTAATRASKRTGRRADLKVSKRAAGWRLHAIVGLQPDATAVRIVITLTLALPLPVPVPQR